MGLAHRANNSCLTVPAQSWLQNSRKLGVPIVDETLGISLRAELVNDITEGKQRSVDVLSFSQSDSFSLSFAGAFGTCQVDEVELRNNHLFALMLDNVDSENSMTARGELVQLRSCNRPLLISLFHEFHNLVEVAHLSLREIFDVDSLGDTFPDIQILVRWFDEIVDTFIVNLDVAAVDLVIFASLRGIFEDFLNRKRNETNLSLGVTLHSMGLT